MLDKIDQFLSLYPEDERVPQVEQLQTIGKAIQHYYGLVNRLSVRSNIPGESRLTEVEKQFLEIIELADENKEAASAKMSAFITVHKNDRDPDQRDVDCLEAAKGYFIKLKNDARAEVLAYLKKIRTAMRGAEDAPTPADKVQTYQSILELYGQVSWGNSSEGREGQELVARAERLLAAAQHELQESENDPVTDIDQ